MKQLEVSPFQAHVPLAWKCSKPSGCPRRRLGAPQWALLSALGTQRGEAAGRKPHSTSPCVGGSRHPVYGLSGHLPGRLGSKFAMQKS